MCAYFYCWSKNLFRNKALETACGKHSVNVEKCSSAHFQFFCSYLLIFLKLWALMAIISMAIGIAHKEMPLSIILNKCRGLCPLFSKTGPL